MIRLDWPRMPDVHACITTVQDGNLARHAGERETVERNRKQLSESLALPAAPFWMSQVHGNDVVVARRSQQSPPDADAAWTSERDLPLVVMVADCLPVLFVSASGDEIAVAHAGWRGLAAGVLAETVSRFSGPARVFLGPAIGPCHYEVDDVVRSAFPDKTGFTLGRDESHWMMDLWAIATAQLAACGVADITCPRLCTYCDERFYSFRQDPDCGRFAALLWRD